MKIYRVYWEDSVQGKCQSWAPNKREAEKDIRQLRDMYKDEDYPPDAIKIELIDFPETKAGIISWLNCLSRFQLQNR